MSEKYSISELPSTLRSALSNIVLPSVNIQSGIMPKAAMVLMAVMMMLRLMLPSNTTAHTLEAPPAGDTPVKNMPRRISGESGNSIRPNT
nr:unnamed protein product [Callosobruchus chinensis]